MCLSVFNSSCMIWSVEWFSFVIRVWLDLFFGFLLLMSVEKRSLLLELMFRFYFNNERLISDYANLVYDASILR